MQRKLQLLVVALAATIAFKSTGTSAFFVDNSGREKEKIVEGNYISIQQAPYQAQIIQLGSSICGATIISVDWLVSAAHCFDNTFGMSVITGSSFRAKGGEKHRISKVIIHRAYNVQTNDNDIALIKLAKPMTFNENQKAVPVATKAPKPGDFLRISGFGKEGEYKGVSAVLKQATVPVIDQRVCVRRYVRDPITGNMFCAGKGGADACQGDSGGPGLINNELAGVVSSGMDCGSKFYPGIYTRVHKYAKWIKERTGIDTDNKNSSSNTRSNTRSNR